MAALAGLQSIRQPSSLPAGIDYLVIQSLGSLPLNFIQGDKPPEFQFFHCSQVKPVEGTAVGGLRMAMLSESGRKNPSRQVAEMERVEIAQRRQSDLILAPLACAYISTQGRCF